MVKGLPSHYEQEHLARVFYPEARMRKSPSTKGGLIYGRLSKSGRIIAAGVRLESGECIVRRERLPNGTADREKRFALSQLLYSVLKEISGTQPPWGLLTGVRPVGLLHSLEGKLGTDGARERFTGLYDVSEDKYLLARQVVRNQEAYISKMGAETYSLYISIPFCPSRCSYCSFVSRSLETDAGLTGAYVDALCHELEMTADTAKKLKLSLKSIYIGGGTPSSLSYEEIARLLTKVKKCYNTENLEEYTFEAGRPDCTDYEKLKLLKEFGVSRISINPQSMNDHVLRAIGRKHSAADVERCFNDARKAGHSRINMDLIAGLPGEDIESFKHSLNRVVRLEPENITLHTLTLKRASNLVIDKSGHNTDPAEMVDYAYSLLSAETYAPYYLYRQKNTLGNYENTGWCLNGCESYYNIAIMEEKQSILSTGAGGSTKIVRSGAGERAEIKRFFNHKYPAEYLKDFNSTVILNNEGVVNYYAGNLDTQTTG